jgi:hypothetical protein
MRSPTMTNTPHLVHVRRQLKRLGEQHVFGLPKSDLERDDPLPAWAAASVGVHMAHHRPWPCTLPWEKVSGKPRTYRLLFQWGDGSYVRYRSCSEQVWKAALASAGVIPAPQTDRRGRTRYQTTRKEGPHQLRHFYASVMLHDGSRSPNWRSSSATRTRRSRCRCTPTCCQAPTTAPGRSWTPACPAPGRR